MEVKYQARLLHDNILFNPNELIIDGRVVIPYDAKKGFIGWANIIVITLIFILIYLVFSVYRKRGGGEQERKNRPDKNR